MIEMSQRRKSDKGDYGNHVGPRHVSSAKNAWEVVTVAGAIALSTLRNSIDQPYRFWYEFFLATFCICVLLLSHISKMYWTAMAATALDVDTYMNAEPSLMDRAFVALTHAMSAGRYEKSPPVQLSAEPSQFMPGLKVNVARTDALGTLTMESPKTAITIGSIRMGFGHHRIAYAATSWALAEDGETYFHDLLATNAREAVMIKNVDSMYSKFSRIASEIGGPVERFWGTLTLSGGANSLRQTWLTAESVTALLYTLPKDVPIISSHSIVGMAAVAAGFHHVINCVIDNHAQWFCIVPGAINLVQGPANLQNLLKMGVPRGEVRLAGHWVPRDVVVNIEEDCAHRLERAKKGAPRRLLISVGGAGAQRKFVLAYIKALRDLIKGGAVTLYINSGDHESMRVKITELLTKMDVRYQEVSEFEDLKKMCASPATFVKESVVVLRFHDYFPAVACTDMLVRVADVLVTKPSELAFYPIPKLMIRRVGDHEAQSALRAVELGEGTEEARTAPEAVVWTELLANGPELFVSMCNKVIDANSVGVYNGSKVAVELAKELARGSSS